MKKTLFNNDWLFWEERDAFALMWSVDANARKINLPHDAMLENDPHAESLNKGNTGFYDGGVYHYSKKFFADEDYADQTLMLHFEGVYMNAQVYVNSELARKQNYGYSGFYVKLNDYLNFDEENEIRVIVRNSGMPNSRWYSGGGIYRDVYLLTGSEIYLRPDGCFITTEKAEADVSVVHVESTVAGRASNRQEMTLHRTVKADDGTIVAQESLPLFLNEGEERKIPSRFTIENAKLWSAEHPHLYTLETVLTREYGDETLVVDEDVCKFGIRSLSIDAKHGFCVNGKTVKLSGACIHHDNGLTGAATYYDFHYRQVQRLKEAGFNAIRMAHHPAAPTLLQACDELGMYVMDECFDTWTRSKTANDYTLFFDQCWEDDVEAMVRKDYNHPSVVLYSIGNEIQEIGTPTGASWAMKLADKIRTLDKTRYTLNSINGLFAVGNIFGRILADVLEAHKDEPAIEVAEDANVNEMMTVLSHAREIVNHPLVTKALSAAGAAVDIAGYNYMTARYENDVRDFPHRVMIGSETYPPQISENWKLVKKLDSLIGDFVWTGWDYIGEAGVGIATYDGVGDGFGTPYPCRMAYSGDIDLTGFMKPAAYLAAIVFGKRTDPYICVQDPVHFNDRVNKTPWSLTDALENWTYPGQEGKPCHVEVYSSGDEVELLLNGVSAGRQPAGEAVGHISRFELEYRPGVLEAVTYTEGLETGRFAVRTAGEAQLKTSVEYGHSGKLVYIDIESRDENGVLKYDGGTDICARIVSGEAQLFIGTGNHSPIENYTSGTAKLFNGRAQVVIVKKEPSEQIAVLVNGETLNV